MNRLLIRPKLGESRHSSYRLPGKEFVYGRASVKDRFNAKATVNEWDAPDVHVHPRMEPPPSRDGMVHGRPSAVKDVATSDVLAMKFSGASRVPRELDYAPQSSLRRPHTSTGHGVRPTRAYMASSSKLRAVAKAAGVGADSSGFAGAGTISAGALAAALSAKGATGGVRLKGDGDWKMSKFAHVDRKVETFKSHSPAAYKELMRRTGKAQLHVVGMSIESP
jgi:hypothetical protein